MGKGLKQSETPMQSIVIAYSTDMQGRKRTKQRELTKKEFKSVKKEFMGVQETGTQAQRNKAFFYQPRRSP